MNSIKMEIVHVIVPIVESMLPRFTDEKNVLVMSFNLSVRGKDDHAEQEVSRTVHLMFHRPGNFTKVLWIVSTEQDSYLEHKVWQVRAHHDSCWRDDGVESPFSKLALDMMREIDPGIRPFDDTDMEVSIFFHGLPELVKIQSWMTDQESRTFTIEYAPKV